MNVTVYVPEELGAEINKRRDALNLSEIFQGAVETALARLEMLDDATDSGGLERLRASKERSDTAWAERGEREGMRWALRGDDYDEIVAVAQLRELFHERRDDQLAEELVAARGEDWTWEEVYGKRHSEEQITNEPAYARGFITGAGEVLDRLNASEGS